MSTTTTVIHQAGGFDTLDNRGEEIEGWLIDNQLVQINQPHDKPSYYYSAWKQTSTPDLAMATEDVHKQISRSANGQLGGSNHLPITLHVADKKTTTEYHRKGASWNYEGANWTKYKLHAEDLCNVTVAVTKDMNQHLKQLTEAIQTAAKTFVPRGFRKDYKPHWSKELATLHQQLSEARACMEQNPSTETTVNVLLSQVVLWFTLYDILHC